MDSGILHKVLRDTFGLPSFRPGQLETLRALFDGGRVLSIQPTGFGKSLLYQLPAVLLDGLTLVISPLLALMRDQIGHLTHRYGIPAAAINSDQSDEENAIAWQQARVGNIKILFIAPEQLDHVDRFASLLELKVSLLVVDEAHCISSWGHDFRPSYRQIAHFVAQMQQREGSIRLLGLTATANRVTEDDIRKQMSFGARDMQVLRASMLRSNLALDVLHLASIDEKLVAAAEIVSRAEGTGLIYCATRERTALVAEYLRMEGIAAAAYHAGLEPEEKKQLQAEFIRDHYKVISATNALGMGIDKPNIRYVMHFDLPGSITAYYQEVGRAGRDGMDARGILLYDPADQRIQRHFIQSAQPEPEHFAKTLQCMEAADSPLSLTQIKMATGLHPTLMTVIIAELVEQGFVQKQSVSGRQVYQTLMSDRTLDLSRYERQYKIKVGELQAMTHYAQQEVDCRMGLLRGALGDDEVTPCGKCSQCLPANRSGPVDQAKVAVVRAWLDQRYQPIEGFVTLKVATGYSLLDVTGRTPIATRFMKERALQDPDIRFWRQWLIPHLRRIQQEQRPQAVVVVPSRTWAGRSAFAQMIGEELGIPVFLDLVQWAQQPSCRQGELCNNDQRRHNVDKKMRVMQLPQLTGSVLLLDDYVGSRTTIKEAARALRQAGLLSMLIPLTIAKVQWKQGQPGLV